MKGSPSTNDLRISLEPATALCLNVLVLVKRTEGPIGELYDADEDILQIVPQLWRELCHYEVMDTLKHVAEQLRY